MNYHQIFFKIHKKEAKRKCQDCQSFIQKGSKILDLGCGSGIMGETLKNFFDAELLGVDIKDKRVVDIPFRIIDGENLPLKENEFEICFISYVLHHTKNPQRILREAKRVSRDKIIIYEDLPEGFLSKFRCYLHRRIYNFFWGNIGEKFKFKTQQEWEELFKDLGFKIVEKKRVFSDFNWIDPVKRILYVLEK